MTVRPPLPFVLAALLGLWVCMTPAQAQVYRVIDANGRVTYTDTPPPPDAKTSQVNVSSSNVTTMLPYELQQVVGRYPVTLYTTANCTPCASGRELLTRRGIPYTERTVNTPQDAEAFQRIGSTGEMPLLVIGSQHVKGFAEAEWTQYLNAAGYPATSQLPSSYRPPAPSALVYIPPKAPARPASIPASMLNGGFPVAPKSTNNPNPNGIRF